MFPLLAQFRILGELWLHAPEQILELALMYGAKNNELPKEDKQELEHYLTLEHIMTLAKAYKLLNGGMK